MRKSLFPRSHEDALYFDARDPLASKRSEFSLPEDTTYLVGHSLGPPTFQSLAHLKSAAEQEWAHDLVGAWNSANWIDLPEIVGHQLSRLIGDQNASVIVCDSVSINLFKLVGALIDHAKIQPRIIVEASEFPTDQYILERLGTNGKVDFIRTGSSVEIDRLQRGDIFVKSLVDYRTGHVAEVEALEKFARKNEFSIVWDLSHATGVLELKVSDWGIKYAVGCTYKYLNGGPGAPAFLYVDPDYLSELETPLAGWLGHARPFAFEPTYQAAHGMQRFVAGTPPILSMRALNGALKIFDDVELRDVQQKAQSLGDMCLARFEALSLTSQSPGIGQSRGGHVSFDHPKAFSLSQAYSELGYKTDFRTPSTIRLGLSPLFLTYADVWNAMDDLERLLKSKAYRDPKYAIRQKVT